MRGAFLKIGLALALSLAFFAAVDTVSAVTSHPVPAVALALACAGATLLVARWGGVAYAVPVAIASLLGFDWYYIPPTHDSDIPDPANMLAIGAYLGVSVLSGQLAARAWRSADVSDVARGVLADEQAALRRVATLVAHGVSQDELLAAVAREAGLLAGVHLVGIGRYDTQESITIVAACGDPAPIDHVGTRWSLQPDAPLAARVLSTGRAARFDWLTGKSCAGPALGGLAVRSGVGCPIVVDRRTWGLMFATSPSALPADTEERLTNFTDLVATAIANADARAEVSRLAQEQAALRRVATLVAEGVPPTELFAAVAEEVGLLLRVDGTAIVAGGAFRAPTVVALWGDLLGGTNAGAPMTANEEAVAAVVLRTGRPALADVSEDEPGYCRERGLCWVAGAPIVVEGRTWGAMLAASTNPELPSAGVDGRIGEFTELLGTAVSNAKARADVARTRAELTASRARVVAAADDARQRLERDLHDGIQQRLVALSLELKGVEERAPSSLDRDLARVGDGLSEALDELREIARGIHPAILTEGGLVPALKALARRSPVAVALDVEIRVQLPQRVEVAAYYVVCEALANAAKHAAATAVDIQVEAVNGALHVSILDDGVGGADSSRGSGLIGLADRVAAIGGSMSVASPPGDGTALRVSLPA